MHRDPLGLPPVKVKSPSYGVEEGGIPCIAFHLNADRRRRSCGGCVPEGKAELLEILREETIADVHLDCPGPEGLRLLQGQALGKAARGDRSPRPFWGTHGGEEEVASYRRLLL